MFSLVEKQHRIYTISREPVQALAMQHIPYHNQNTKIGRK